MSDVFDWVCQGCGAKFAEYINGCPHCSQNGLHFSVRQTPSSQPPNRDVPCYTCGNPADALIHKVETYRRVPGGYGHPFAAPAGNVPELVTDSTTPHLPMACGNRYCAQHRDIWRHYEDVIAPADAPQHPVAAETPEQMAIRYKLCTWDQGDDGFGGEWVADTRAAAALRDQASQYDARIAELERENRGYERVIVKTGNWDAYLAEVATRRAESAEAERDNWQLAQESTTDALKRACDQRDAAAAERDAAVGQVAVLREALQSVTNYFWGTEPPVLKEGDVQAEVEEALASSAPLVAAYKAEIEAGALEEVALMIERFNHTFADWLRARAQEKRKAGTQAH